MRVFLRSLDPKIPKVVKKNVLPTAFVGLPTVYNGRYCRLFRKSYNNARVGSYRPVMSLYIYFILIRDKLEDIRQGK